MSSEPDNNPREELYRRFRESLHKPVGERFFDEDELVEVYDYAGDLNDDYVQLEALFCGARLYPDSAQLSERRALLYLDTSVDDSDEPSPAADKYLSDNAEVFSPIFDIARLQVHRPDDAEAALEFLLNQYEVFGDEEMIRFLDLAFDLGQYDWVKSNLSRLRKKVQYQPVLLYELLHEADDRMDNDFAAAIAEELIEGEPFAVIYWIALFKAQARAGKEVEARSSFDYARALGSDDRDSLLSLAEAAYNYAPYLTAETLELMEALHREAPDDFVYIDCMCALNVRMGAPARAMEMLKSYLDSHPSDYRAMHQLLVCNTDDAAVYLRRLYEATDGKGFPADAMAEMINTLSMNMASRSLAALLSIAEEYGEIEPTDFTSWVEALFALGKYNAITELFDRVRQLPEGADFIELATRIPLKGPSTSFAYLVALMKQGKQAEADAYLAELEPFMEKVMEAAPMPIRMVVRTVQTLADKIRQHPASDTLYWEYFDMLNYSKL